MALTKRKLREWEKEQSLNKIKKGIESLEAEYARKQSTSKTEKTDTGATITDSRRARGFDDSEALQQEKRRQETNEKNQDMAKQKVANAVNAYIVDNSLNENKQINNSSSAKTRQTDARQVYESKGISPKIINSPLDQSLYPMSNLTRDIQNRAFVKTTNDMRQERATYNLKNTIKNLEEKREKLRENPNLQEDKALRDEYTSLTKEINDAKYQLELATPKSSIDYIQKRGVESFDNAMENINTTANALGSGAIAFVKTLFGNKNNSENPFKIAKEAYANSLEESNNEKNQFANVTDYADTNPAYENARSKKITKVLGDLTSSMSNMLPSVMLSYAGAGASPLLGSVLSTMTTAANSNAEAYDEARNDGATQEEALKYATLEAANQAGSDMLIGGVVGIGNGLIDTVVSKYSGNALNAFFRSKPMLKAVSDTALKAGGEGAEEIIQSLITTANKQLTYDPDAKVNARELAYEGLLGGLMGTAYSIPTIPGKYYVYKSDYETVNNISRAAADISSFESAQFVEQVADAVISSCENEISSLKKERQTTDIKEDVLRLEYILENVKSTKDILSDHAENIISQNIAKSDALEKILDGNINDVEHNVSEFVWTISENIEQGDNALNAAIDYVRQEIRGKDSQYMMFNASNEQEAARKAKIDRNSLIKIDEILRNNRNNIENYIKSKRSDNDINVFDDTINSTPKNNSNSNAIDNTFDAANNTTNATGYSSKISTKDIIKEVDTNNNTQNSTSENKLKALQSEIESSIIESKEEAQAPKEFQLHHVVHTHTKTGEKMDVFKIEKSLSDKDYARLKKLMKDIGGYYSSYAGGFIVKNPEAVSSFADTDYVKPTENTSEPNTAEKVETVNATDNTTNDTEVKKPETKKENTAKETKKQSEKKLQMPQKPVYHEGKDVEQYFLPGRKTPFTVSTQAAFDTIEVLSGESNTIQELYDNIKSDSSAKHVVGKYIENGYGSYSPNEVFGFSGESNTDDWLDSIDPSEIHEKLAERGFVNGKIVDREKFMTNSPFSYLMGQHQSHGTNGESKEPSAQISDYVYDKLDSARAITFNDLQEAANKAYGGTMAEGTYDIKAMMDAMELGVNRRIIDLVSQKQSDFNSSNPNDAADSIREINDDILTLIPTQTKRSEEQISLQQFSTPPNIAYLASWVANINGTDVVLEPSAGIGGLASFAKADGATVYVNELSDSRLSMLKQLPFDGFYQENAEQIDNILPDEVKPSVVLMNPPFSSTGGRTKNSTKNAIPHIEQALARLEDGGRLVAIVGKGMANDTPTFRGWYDELRKNYDIRANVGINGENYRKYGTTFDVQMLVIDKTGAQKGETIVGNYDKLEDIPEILKGVRNDRNRTDKQLETRSTGERNNGVSLHDTKSKTDMVDTVSQRNRGDSQLESVESRQQNVVDSNGRSDTGRSNVVGEERHENVQEADRSGAGTERGGLDTGVQDSEGQLKTVHTGESGFQSPREDRPGLGQTELRERMASGERSVTADGGESGNVIKQTVKKETKKKVAESDNGVYASYVPAKLTVTGAKKHPAKLVESAAMSAVSMPELHYTPHLDQSLIDSGALSDAQLENISYAGQAHEQVLSNGTRKGYFIGDGTGVGKGRQIAGIIMDNFNQGRKKAVWVSEKAGLFEDATRDWNDLGGGEGELLDFSKAKIKKNLQGYADGILFSTYDTLRSGGTKDDAGKKTGSNVDSIIEWLGKDFDGVIVFDEVQNLGNLSGKKTERGKTNGSMKAIAGNKLQESVPNARIVYVSATGATDIANLAYASRLGLWGEGTSFSNMEDFTAKIGRSGIAAMELVARDMKSMGVYLARSISYDDVKYDQIQHKLTKDQQYMYDTMSEGWQVVVQDVNKALQLTGGDKNSSARRSTGQVWSTMQNFYSQVLTSMSVPSVIKDIEKELAAGHSCVIQIVNTNEAAQDRAVSNAKESGDTSLDNLDITPRQMITQYVQNAFPVQQYEEYIDEQGNKISKPVVDSKGNPVENKQAVRMRDKLLAKISEISIPEGPLDMIISHFGVDNVAEITGRNSRVVDRTDENGDVKKTLERRNSKSANIAEAKDFQDGKKRILVFSKAGGTGRSFHASNKAKNKEQRIHYVLQAGWKADDAVQGFGRTHRSDEANAPVYKLVTTNVMGQKRFVTSIARRLDQLGALTKGQRETGSGIFGEKDNLESPLSREALRTFYKKLGAGQLSDIDPQSTLQKMGLERKFYDEYGRFNLNEVEASDITHFLNRLLALPVDEQNRVFDAFEEIREQYYEAAIEAGTLDIGMENVKADKVTVEQDSVVRTDESTGAETKYVRATVFTKPTVIESVEDAKVFAKNFVGIRRTEDGSVRAVYRISNQTNAYGVVTKRYRLQSANTVTVNIMSEKNMEAKTELVPESEWDSAWVEAVKEVPEYNERTVHMITGALLPIWNKLPGDGVVKAMRLTAENGAQYLGRIIPPKQIDFVLRQLDVKGGNKKTYTGKEVYSAVMDKAQTVVFNGQYGGTMSIVRRRVSGENRIEILGGNLFSLKSKYPDIIQENIQFKNRYFIPTGAKGEAILSDMIETYKVRSIGEREDGDIYYKRKTSEEIRNADEAIKEDKPISLDDLKRKTEKMFGIPINYGRTNGMAAMYKTKEDTIRINKAGNFLTVAHEIGHKLDNRYKFSSIPEISELRTAFYDSLVKEGYVEPQIPSELVAEYVKTYMENAEYAKSEFPEFTKVFLKTLDSRDSDNVARLSFMANAYYDSETNARAQAAVHNRAQENTIFNEFVGSVKELHRDPATFVGAESNKAWKTFMANFVDNVDIFNHFGSAYTMAMRERQSGAVVRGWLKGSATDKNGKIIGPGLADTLSMTNITPDQRLAFDSYLVDLAAYDHKEYEKKNPSGKANAGRVYGDQRVQDTIEKRIKETESKYPHFVNAAQAVFEYDNMLMERAIESGIVSAKTVSTWQEIYPHYSPLYRVMDDKKAPISVFESFKGSGRDVYSPIENRILQTEKIVRSAMKNDIALAFFDFIDKNEGMGAFAEKVPPKMYKEVIGLFPNYEKLKNYDMQTLSHMTEDERQAVIEEVQEAMGNVAESWRVQNFQGKNIVAVMRNGKPELYEIHDKFVLDALTSFSKQEMNVVVKVWRAMTNGFKVLTTGANPFFAIPNAIRDIQTGYITSNTTNNPIKYMADFFVAVGDTLTQNQTYKDFMNAGGGYENAIRGDAQALRNIEWDMLPHSTVERILHVPARISEVFEHFVNTSETANRLADYKRTVKNGGSVLEGMRNQQEITVNFSRHGKIAKQIDTFIPYFNATIQSYYKLFDTLFGKHDSKQKRNAWAKLIGVNVFIAALAIASRSIRSKITGEDEEKEYQQLSPYIKNAYWCFPTGDGNFVKIPKQKDFMLLSTALERLVEYTKMENPRAFYQFDDYLESVLVLPHSLDDVTLFGTGLSLAKNETFTGSPIVPYAYQNLLPEEQYNENTSEFAKKIGSTLHISPMQVQFALDDNFGFIAKFVSYTSDAIDAFYDGGITAAVKNGLDSLTSTFRVDNTYSTGEISYFYDTKNGYDTRSATYKVHGEGDGQTFYDTYGAYKYDKIADVYSKCNTLIKQDEDEDNSRSTRRELIAFIKAVNDTEVSEIDEQTSALAEATGCDVSDIAPYIVTPNTITQRYNKQSYYVELTAEDMMEYYLEAQFLFELNYPDVLNAVGDSKEKAALLAEYKKKINTHMRDTWFEKIMERDGAKKKED